MSALPKSEPRALSKARKATLVARLTHLFHIEEIVDGSRWTVGPGDHRQGQHGRAVAIVGLKHSAGYEVVLQLDHDKMDSFSPMQLMPETD